MEEFTKLAVIGLSKVGKTSIFKRCFENYDLKDLGKITPTIMVSQNTVNLKHVSKGISIWDFGGQDAFRKAYFQTPTYFEKTRIIIFVIDILSPEDLPEVKSYFRPILQIFENFKENENQPPPKKFVFLHKCDPNKTETVKENIAKSLLEMTTLFGKDVPIYMTSIYDDSACKSLNNILFFSLPDEVLSQVFSIDFFEEIRTAITRESANKSIAEIKNISKIYGDLGGKKIFDLWMRHSVEKIGEKEKKSRQPTDLEVIYKDNKKSFKYKCPYSTEKKECSERDCIMLQEFITGVLHSININPMSIKVEMIKEKEDCYFLF